MRFLTWLYGLTQFWLDFVICVLFDAWDCIWHGDDNPRYHRGKWTRPVRLAAALRGSEFFRVSRCDRLPVGIKYVCRVYLTQGITTVAFYGVEQR